MDFKGNLKELRIEKNFTQKELATYLNMSKNVVCEWEKGRSEPSIDNLKKLSAIFECSIDFLLGESDEYNIFKDKTVEQHSEFERQIIATVREYPKGYEEEALRAVKNGLILAQHKANEKISKRNY